jgi:hypothetical protein
MNTEKIEPCQTPKAIVNWLYAEVLNGGDLDIADQLIKLQRRGPWSIVWASFSK